MRRPKCNGVADPSLQQRVRMVQAKGPNQVLDAVMQRYAGMEARHGNYNNDNNNNNSNNNDNDKDINTNNNKASIHRNTVKWTAGWL